MYETQVARGVAVLDKEVPGWEDKINIDNLVMSDITRCVVGQVFGFEDVWEGEWRRYINGLTVLGADDDPTGFGFDIDSELDAIYHPHEYEQLRKVWVDVIMERRAAAQPSQADHVLVA